MRRQELATELDNTFKKLLGGIFNEEGVYAIETSLVLLASDDDVRKVASGADRALDGLLQAQEEGNVEEREFSVLELYRCLHSGGWTYDRGEKMALDSRKGHQCLPGGLLPLFMAGHFIAGESVFADLGAGNGLQGLLMQKLRPHRLTMQTELSAAMIEVGRLYRDVLGIDENRVRWVHGDIADAELDGVDLVYLYRPARPMGKGIELYHAISGALAGLTAPVTVISVADCLGRFLDRRFVSLYENEFLTIFTNVTQDLSNADTGC